MNRISRFVAVFLLTTIVSSSTSYAQQGPVYLEQFGGGIASADNAPAYSAAIASMGPNGGVLELGCGTYQFDSGLTVPSYVTIEGCGTPGTTLDFTGMTAVGAALTVGRWENHLRDFMIIGPNGPGIKVNLTGTWDNYGSISNVDVTNTRTGHHYPCLAIDDAWMYSFSDMILKDCDEHGVKVHGYSTSLTFRNVYVNGAVNSCFWLNDITYSSFMSPAADHCGEYAYSLRNANGVTFSSPGAEDNGFGMFLAHASNAIAAGATSPDIKGIVITGAFSYMSGTKASYYSSLLEAAGFDGRRVDVTLIGPVTHTSPNNIAILMKGSNTKVVRVGGTIIGTATPTLGATYSVLQ